MSAQYDVVLGDRFTSTSDKIGDSADKTHAKIVAMQNAAKQGVRLGAFSLGGGSGAGRSGGGRAAYNEAADGWNKARAAAEKANRSLGLAQSAAIAMDQRRTVSMAREATKREAIVEREVRAKLRAAAKLGAARERAAHKYYYGGKKSFGSLIQSQHEHQVSGAASSIAGHLTPMGLAGAAATGLGVAADAVTTLVTGSAAIAYNFGKATIAAQSMREESVEGFNAIFKSTTAGDKLFDQARDIAKKTKFETPQVIARFNALGGRGFGENQIGRIYNTISDVETGRGPREGFRAAQRYQNSLANLNSRERPVFAQFQQGADASGGLKLAEQALGTRLGLKESGGKLDDKIRKMFKARKISGNDAMEALIAGTNARYNPGGKEGQFAEKQGDKTWGGAISNIKSGLGDVLNMKMDDQKGLAGFKTLLQAIGSTGGLFDQTSARGKEFAAVVSSFVEDLFMPFGGITLDNTGNILDRILGVAKEVEVRFKAIMKEITAGWNDFMKDPKGSVINLATDIGVAIGTGIMQVAGNLLGRAWNATGGALAGGVYGLIAPESQKAVADGDDTDDAPAQRQSLALGGVVQGPAGSRQLIYAHGGEVVSGLHGEYGGRSRGGGSTYEVTINVMVQGTQDPIATAQRAAAEFEMAADRYFGRLLAQG